MIQPKGFIQFDRDIDKKYGGVFMMLYLNTQSDDTRLIHGGKGNETVDHPYPTNVFWSLSELFNSPFKLELIYG